MFSRIRLAALSVLLAAGSVTLANVGSAETLNLGGTGGAVAMMRQVGARGIAFGISLTRESVLARFGRHGFYLRHTITGGRVGSVRRLL